MGMGQSKVVEQDPRILPKTKQDLLDHSITIDNRIKEILLENLEKNGASYFLLPWIIHALENEKRERNQPEAALSLATEVDAGDDPTLPKVSTTEAALAVAAEVDAGDDPTFIKVSTTEAALTAAAEDAGDETRLTKVSTTEEVVQEVKKAREQKINLRATGSEHSVSKAIFPDSTNGKTLRLSGQLREVTMIRETTEDSKKVAYFRIGAGCYLGLSPSDPSSTLKNSACFQINDKGYAFPDLGGITHQSVGGFLMTGSSGGTLRRGFADVIGDIEFVNGQGEVKIAEKGSDLWNAVGVSMGLFGIITHVTFRLSERYMVEGTEINYEFEKSVLGPGEHGQSQLEAALKDREYCRITWFPEKYLDRVTEWKCHQTPAKAIEPYHPVLQDPLTRMAAVIVLKITNCIQQMQHPTELDDKIMAILLSQFLPLNKLQKFCDWWYKTLPMDDKMGHIFIRVDFTEIWIPVEQSQEVIQTLNEMFTNNPRSAGSFGVEVYGAKESPFWMSMSYGVDAIRIDPFWWHYNKGDPGEYFAYFWNALLGFECARLHWGKWLPKPGQKCGDVVFDTEWVKKAYPKYEEWMKLRNESDPDQLFVSSYWRNILGIPTVTKTDE